MVLDGRVCVITGATSGIGRALAGAFAEAGAHVWAIGRSRARLDALAAELAGSAERISPVLADLEQDEGVAVATERILAGGDRIDVLVHSAGAIWLGHLESAPAAELERLYRVNLRAPYLLTQALVPAVKRARGQIVFINSNAALKASADHTLYAVTKRGLRAFADGLRDEVNADGVRVLSVYAGRADTPMQEIVHEHEERPYRPEFLMRPGDVVHVVLAALALPASAEVTEVSVRPMMKLPPR